MAGIFSCYFSLQNAGVLLRVDKVYLVMVNFYEKSLKRDEVYEGSCSVEFSELL